MQLRDEEDNREKQRQNKDVLRISNQAVSDFLDDLTANP
jgi:hypothetical protein